MAKTTEGDILKALRAWHKERGTLFFSHVKTGSSWDRSQLRILDGLGVKITWTEPVFEGYEVKVSRSDFLRDKKYAEYLPYCTRFSFVVPYNMVKKEEVPHNIGLIYYLDDGRLITRKAAPPLGVDPESLMSMLRYLVYYRTGSDRQKVAAAQLQAQHDRYQRNAAEKQEKYYRNLYYAARSKLYELGYRGAIE